MIVVLHKTQVLCYPALLNIVLLIVFSMLYTNLTGLIFDFSKINNTFAV